MVADTIPAEIYQIPPSSPLFHDRYVYVYGATPDLVYFGYTPGYLGAYVSDGVVVFGTGWVYPPWIGDYWFGWPWTWGFGFDFGYWGGGWFWRPVGYYWWYHNPWYMHRIYSEHWNPHWHPGDAERFHYNANVYNRWQGNAVARAARPMAGSKSRAGGAVPRQVRRPQRTLNDLVRQGKVGYIGLSNLMSWQAATAVMLQDRLGLEKYVTAQMYYSLSAGGLEHEFQSFAEYYNIGILAVWSPLAGGFLTGKYTRANPAPGGSRFAEARQFVPFYKEMGYRVVDALNQVAARHGASPARVAIGWLSPAWQ